MEQNIIMLIVAFLLIITLGMQLQLRKINKKMDDLLQKK
jgi:hypothetical protein